MRIYIGFDPQEIAAFAVARASILYRSTQPSSVTGLVLDDLRRRGLYWRPTETIILPSGRRQLIDVISEAPMSTEFAISRFLVPLIAKTGFAIFMDSDVMCRVNIARIMDHVDPSKAVSVVKHNFAPKDTAKMDGQVQTVYPRKNWSSVMVFNCDHKSNRQFGLNTINEIPGRDLHRFCWLQDDEIGELPPEWNYLVGHTQLPAGTFPKIVHWTDGCPTTPGYENAPYAEEFRDELYRWAR